MYIYTLLPVCTGTAVLWSPLKVVPMDEEEDAASAPVINNTNKTQKLYTSYMNLCITYLHCH